jgi:DinB superfamily
MKKATLKALKYPTGEFKMPKKFSERDIESRIKIIGNFPAKLKTEVAKMTEPMLEYRHRLGGWTVRQLVHHCADSHINAYVRTKLAYTESNPVIKPYDESAWANTGDAGAAPVEWSLQLLDGLHKRWVMLLMELNADDLKKTYFHPEAKKRIPLSYLIFLYSWHCEHHLAHIKQAVKFKNKFK